MCDCAVMDAVVEWAVFSSSYVVHKSVYNAAKINVSTCRVHCIAPRNNQAQSGKQGRQAGGQANKAEAGPVNSKREGKPKHRCVNPI